MELEKFMAFIICGPLKNDVEDPLKKVKINSLCSDLIYATTRGRGRVKLAKNILLGMLILIFFHN